jgi:beta-lactam-binding protein with PASTA domain
MLAALGVGYTVIFDATKLSDDTVVSTSPAANKPLKRGDTVKIFVDEPAPQLNVPDVLGVDCKTAGKQIAATGFTPAYPYGKDGAVIGENPAPTDQNAHWNDTIQLSCGTPSSPPASPSPSASAQGPDGDQPSAGASN